MNKLGSIVVLSITAMFLAGCTAAPEVNIETPSLNSACGVSSNSGLLLLDSPCPGVGSGGSFKVSGKVKTVDAINIVAEFYDASGTKFDTETIQLLPSVAAGEGKTFNQNIDLNSTAKSIKLTLNGAANNSLDQITIDLAEGR